MQDNMKKCLIIRCDPHQEENEEMKKKAAAAGLSGAGKEELTEEQLREEEEVRAPGLSHSPNQGAHAGLMWS